MVETSKEERAKPQLAFERMAEILYNWDSEIKITQVKKYNKLAHINKRNWGKDLLGLNFEKFREMSEEEQFATLIHEATHIEKSGHTREFWEELAENTRKLEEHKSLFNNFYDLNWRELELEIVKDADHASVDERSMSPQGAQLLMARLLDVEYNPFEEMTLSQSNSRLSQTVNVKDVEKKQFSDEELARFVRDNMNYRKVFGSYRPSVKPVVKTVRGRIYPSAYNEEQLEKVEKVWALFDRMGEETVQGFFARDIVGDDLYEKYQGMDDFITNAP